MLGHKVQNKSGKASKKVGSYNSPSVKVGLYNNPNHKVGMYNGSSSKGGSSYSQIGK